MTERLDGYGYFSSIKDLETAVGARGGNKKGHAVIYEGAQVVNDEKGLRVEGNPTRVLKVRVLTTGTLDIRADDSWDNE